MHDTKKYQIFISSTYTDLRHERDEVMKSILTHYHIPIGMEMFSADDDEQWVTIKETIDASDYYVLIIGHRYGSLAKEGISYTEKEFRYAVESKIPTYVFIRERDVATQPSQRDKEPELAVKLDEFIQSASHNRMINFWKNKDDLSLVVMAALNKAFTRTKRIGWVRSDQVLNSDAVLEQMSELTKRNMELLNENEALKISAKHALRQPSFSFSFNGDKPLCLTINDSLFSKHQFAPDDEEYNQEKLIFLRRFCLERLPFVLTNVGTLTATNIYIDFDFPKGVSFYDSERKIENFRHPKKRQEANDIKDADVRFFRGLTRYVSIEQPARYSITWMANLSRLTLFINELPHTRTFIFSQSYIAAIDIVDNPILKVKISCDELPEPILYEFAFEVRTVNIIDFDTLW